MKTLTRIHRYGLAVILMTLVGVGLSGCAQNKDDLQAVAVDITGSFVSDYYVDDDLQAALKLSAGDARDKLSTEWATRTEIAQGEQAENQDADAISYEFVDATQLAPENYVVSWHVQNGYLQQIYVEVHIADQGQGWKIIDFKEVRHSDGKLSSSH